MVHRDLRPAKMLLSAAGKLKVTFFGSALMLPAGPSRSPSSPVRNSAVPAVETPPPTRYTASELHPSRGGGGDGLEDRADVYSAAMVLWALFACPAPHPRLSDSAAAAAAADPAIQLWPGWAGGGRAAAGQGVREAVRGAWEDEAGRRPDALGLLGGDRGGERGRRGVRGGMCRVVTGRVASNLARRTGRGAPSRCF